MSVGGYTGVGFEGYEDFAVDDVDGLEDVSDVDNTAELDTMGDSVTATEPSSEGGNYFEKLFSSLSGRFGNHDDLISQTNKGDAFLRTRNNQ